MSRHHTRDNQCPSCHTKLDAATNADGHNSFPEEGDLSICINCHHVLVFDKNLVLKPMTAEIFKTLHHEDVEALLRAGAVLHHLQQIL